MYIITQDKTPKITNKYSFNSNERFNNIINNLRPETDRINDLKGIKFKNEYINKSLNDIYENLKDLNDKLYSKIDSFKNFIWADNKKDYDIIMSKDENYLYNILAASYTLELEQDIYKKMKEYDVKKPDWFELKEDFTVQKLSNSIERLYNLLKEKKED